MPRILHVINRLAMGGAEVMLLDIIRNSNRHEFDFHVLCPFGEGELDERAKSYGVEVHYLPGSKTLNRKRLFDEGVRFIKSLNPDIVNTHTRFSDLVGLVGGRRAGIGMRIMTVHAAGLYFLDSKPFYQGAIEYFVVRFAKHYVAVSDAVNTYVQKYGRVAPEKVTTIHNGIDPSRVCQPSGRKRSEIRLSLGIDNSRFFLVSVGRLVHEKGFDILLFEFAELLEKFNDLHLLITGSGPEEKKLKKITRDLHISDNVTFLSTVDNLSDLFTAADCFVLPSRSEGFGLAVLEAMANGLPVIASDTGGIPEIIESGKNGMLFSIKKCGDLSNALEKFHSDTELRLQLSSEGKKTALKKFHISCTAKKYEALYKSLLV